MSDEQPQTQATLTNEAELNTSPLLSMVVERNSELKDYLVEYVGTKLDNENVTVEMITEVLATEFPEFVISLAEENFLLGYEQGLKDADGLHPRKAETVEE
jgi:hypothetical protein